MTNDAATGPEAANLSSANPPGALTVPTRHMRQNIQVSLTIGFLVLGILLALQVNTQKAIRQDRGFRRSDWWYQGQLRDRDQRLLKLEKRNEELTRRVAQFERSTGKTSEAGRILKNELEIVRMLAGFTPLKGPGTVVLVSDNPRALKIGADYYAGIVHDEDLLRLVNELWNAGAEAVAVNGIRLCAGWDIRCAGSIIKVRGQHVASPYRVEAIGDPAVLESAMKLPDGITDYLRAAGLKVTSRTVNMLSLSAAIPVKFKVARAASEGKEGGS